MQGRCKRLGNRWHSVLLILIAANTKHVFGGAKLRVYLTAKLNRITLGMHLGGTTQNIGHLICLTLQNHADPHGKVLKILAGVSKFSNGRRFASLQKVTNSNLVHILCSKNIHAPMSAQRNCCGVIHLAKSLFHTLFHRYRRAVYTSVHRVFLHVETGRSGGPNEHGESRIRRRKWICIGFGFLRTANLTGQCTAKNGCCHTAKQHTSVLPDDSPFEVEKMA